MSKSVPYGDNFYRPAWKAARGYYEVQPAFRWLSDEECAFWEDLRRERAETLAATLPRSETAWRIAFGLEDPAPAPRGRVDKDEVKSRVDMRELAERYGATFRSQGRRPVGTCPLHKDKRPSFSLDLDRKLFHCFGCGEAGDCFTLVMKAEECTFYEAVRNLNATY